LYPGVAAALDALADVIPIACLTDGHPAIQAAKLAATGLDRRLRIVIVTDALGGRAVRKPHPHGLLEAAARLCVPADRLLVIGDRPTKDIAEAAAVGARAIRIRQGEYAAAPDDPMAWAIVESFPSAADIARAVVQGRRIRSVRGPAPA
jgi:putative hydrolase of the HAD superfamily